MTPTYCIACGQRFSIRARGQIQNAHCPWNGTHVWVSEKPPQTSDTKEAK